MMLIPVAIQQVENVIPGKMSGSRGSPVVLTGVEMTQQAGPKHSIQSAGN